MPIQVIGHRGARGLLPESSLPGFAKALDLGVDMIELDVGITRDEIVVVHHDRMLNPNITRDSTGCWIEDESIEICNLNYEELIRYDVGRIKPDSDYERQFPHQIPCDGVQVPTLEDIVTLLRSKGRQVTLCIEAKFEPVQPRTTHPLEKFADILAREIIRLDLASTAIIQSFDWQMTHAVREQVSGLGAWHLTSQLPMFDTLDESLNGAYTSGLRLSDFGGSVPEMIIAAGGDVWSGDHRTLTAHSIAEAKRLGLRTYAWTVNAEEEFRELCDAGIDGMVTDYPDHLISFLERQA